MIKVGVIGGTGYTGAELLRLLTGHPNVEIAAVTSRSNQGELVSDIYPNLRGIVDVPFVTPELNNLSGCDVVFFATPHGVAQSSVPGFLEAGIKVIDLSADFRLRDQSVWEKWYGQPHQASGLLPRAVYGLPEVNREAIVGADLVACAGCYPTSIQLGLLPLLRQGSVDSSDIIANSASGVSGAGRQANISALFSEASDSFKAYGASGHRHQPEIEQGLEDIAGHSVGLTFVPHLLPINRGIHTTIYANLVDLNVDIQELYEYHFKNEPFIDVLPAGSHPETRTVRGSNYCRIAVHRPDNGRKVIVLVVEDNLTKGASGQAIQCMNLMFGLPEILGLMMPGLLP
ncbi:MAG TPA: N-acetyl-gamma-glutamyl-phosphate reductase [Porticoccaceae bacterium]|nr:N-acetyl-gamma-glutamyl-phosphate reductase [Porticoccaceae bacterium]HIG67811.1 N-acetyl-gamma-glutamyl-phosphate reductase [Porticoccaceae bacterium]HIK81237.1 N-acetyl-gamma-glutamyl-phosphate reductase [Porticoccaceae bacterium]